MTAIQTPKKPANAPLFKWEGGKSYVCIMSKSPGYAVGETYQAYANEKGYICLRGRDGYEDLCSMLVSSFRAADKARLEVVS